MAVHLSPRRAYTCSHSAWLDRRPSAVTVPPGGRGDRRGDATRADAVQAGMLKRILPGVPPVELNGLRKQGNAPAETAITSADMVKASVMMQE